MPELVSSVEAPRLKNYATAVALMSALGLGLTGCSMSAESMETMTPKDRFFLDYVASPSFYPGLSYLDFDGNGCLLQSPFNTYAEDGRPSLSYNEGTGILTVTAKTGEILSLEGLDQIEHTLSPANEASESIFDAYGCVVTDYDQE